MTEAGGCSTLTLLQLEGAKNVLGAGGGPELVVGSLSHFMGKLGAGCAASALTPRPLAAGALSRCTSALGSTSLFTSLFTLLDETPPSLLTCTPPLMAASAAACPNAEAGACWTCGSLRSGTPPGGGADEEGP